MSSAADIYIWAFGGGMAVLLILLNVFAIALCKSAARVDQLAAEHFEALLMKNATMKDSGAPHLIPEMNNSAARFAQRDEDL